MKLVDRAERCFRFFSSTSHGVIRALRVSVRVGVRPALEVHHAGTPRSTISRDFPFSGLPTRKTRPGAAALPYRLSDARHKLPTSLMAHMRHQTGRVPGRQRIEILISILRIHALFRPASRPPKLPIDVCQRLNGPGAKARFARGPLGGCRGDNGFLSPFANQCPPSRSPGCSSGANIALFAAFRYASFASIVPSLTRFMRL